MEIPDRYDDGASSGQRWRWPVLTEHDRLALIAPFLSFLWPGLGQLYLGQRRWALLHGLPPLLLLLYAFYLLVDAPESLALRLLIPSYALGVMWLIAAHALWRSLSVIDAWWRSRPAGSFWRNQSAMVALALVVAIIAAHGSAGWYVQSYSVAGRPVFTGQPPPAPQATPAASSGAAEPSPTPEDLLGDILGEELPTTDLGFGLDPGPGIPRDGPLSVLFVGVDSGPGRDHALTDVLMVGAFDRRRNEMALINVPRDTGRFPLYKGGIYPNRINSFLSHARGNPDLYPEGAIRALTNQLAFLVGIPIHYYAVIDMAGFERLVDLVGGVTVTIDYSIADPVRKLYLDPGLHRLDGAQALAFVRSRHGPSNSDYRRAQRQQQVIRAIADRLRDPGVVVRLPEIAREASRMARTNIPIDNLEQFLEVLDDITDATPTRVVLQPRKYAQRVPPSEVGGRFMTELKMDAVATLSMELFGQYSLYSRRVDPIHPPSLAPTPVR